MTSIEDLWKEIDLRARLLEPVEVDLVASVGRIAAVDHHSRFQQPPFDQSAMDGYALPSLVPGIFPIHGVVEAGHPTIRKLKAGHATKILTGGWVPEGTACVVKQEDCEVSDNHLSVKGALTPGSWIRREGEVLARGQNVLVRGERVTPGRIALLASAGINRVSVTAHPSVTHLVTGDEILLPGESPRPGSIPDSNGPMVAAILASRGLPVYQRLLRDDASLLLEALMENESDLLLISGGSGPGDRDHTRACLEKAGYSIHVSILNSRPGRPLVFASRGKQLAFGLPGNPLSHFVCFHAFAARALDAMEGRGTKAWIPAHLKTPWIVRGDGRRSWTPCRWEISSGEAEVEIMDWVHSGDLRGLAHANGLILETPEAADGRVKVLPV